MADNYGAVGTLQLDNCWNAPSMASNWRIHFSEDRYPIVINHILNNSGDVTLMEIYDNHGQKYIHTIQTRYPTQNYIPIIQSKYATQNYIQILQSKHAIGGFGCYSSISHVPPDGIFRCICQKEYATPLSPPLIDLIKCQSISRIVKELEATKMELETLKAKLAERTGLATPA